MVLDIGAGTGLLAMMAVRAGARHVVACEQFKGLAAMAKLVVSDSGMDDRISIICCNSGALTAATVSEITGTGESHLQP